MGATIEATAFEVAKRFEGVAELPGPKDNPLVLAMLRLDQTWPAGDAVPWCSAFVNFVCFILGLPRSRSLAARSWRNVGRPVKLAEAVVGFDLVILRRGGPLRLEEDGPGHVGFFAGFDAARGAVRVLGGNQGDRVSVAPFPVEQVLGVRRLHG